MRRLYLLGAAALAAMLLASSPAKASRPWWPRTPDVICYMAHNPPAPGFPGGCVIVGWAEAQR